MTKYLWILLFAISFNANSQIYDSISKSSVKIDLVNVLDNFPAVLLSFEHRISKTFYLNHEAGFILPEGERIEGKLSGFKLREELRAYIGSSGITDLYTAFDIRYTREQVERNIVLGYQCEGGCQFFKGVTGNFRKEQFAVGFRLGVRHSFYPMFLEYDLGYSYGKDFISIPDVAVPSSYEIRSSDPFNLWTTDSKPYVTARVKLGLYIRTSRE